jgi:hypothetical protein
MLGGAFRPDSLVRRSKWPDLGFCGFESAGIRRFVILITWIRWATNPGRFDRPWGVKPILFSVQVDLSPWLSLGPVILEPYAAERDVLWARRDAPRELVSWYRLPFERGPHRQPSRTSEGSPFPLQPVHLSILEMVTAGASIGDSSKSIGILLAAAGYALLRRVY